MGEKKEYSRLGGGGKKTFLLQRAGGVLESQYSNRQSRRAWGCSGEKMGFHAVRKIWGRVGREEVIRSHSVSRRNFKS